MEVQRNTKLMDAATRKPEWRHTHSQVQDAETTPWMRLGMTAGPGYISRMRNDCKAEWAGLLDTL